MTVLDASAALSRVMPSQATPAATAFFDKFVGGFRAPAVFEAEVSNALLRAVRQGRFDPALVEISIDTLLAVVVRRGVAVEDLR